MKIQLLKKYYAFIMMMISFTVSEAQIVYTDVNPDTTFNTNGDIYALDLNNDGITDFNITFTTAIFAGRTNKFILITPLGANKVGTDYIYPSALPLNTLIEDSSFTWLSTAQPLISRIWFIPPNQQPGLWQYRGNWNGVSDKYVPLQLDLSSQKFYGWARLDVAIDSASFTVKDYAYNSISGQSILSGQTITTGINENPITSSIYLFPNPADNHLAIDLGINYGKVQVTIADITGKVMYTTMASDTQKVEVNTCDFAEGIYVVQIKTGDLIGTKKLVVAK